ncbi:MAG: lysophospholipid acyltransferase family protein [Gammaproteobacteria bacterium]|nr:lysophospholipid acyltransferase family protein [Gammaproteobacteria bacterium]
MSKPQQSIHPGPRSGLLLQLVGKVFLKATGWKFEGSLPNAAGMVVIAAPHTSNWDFIYFLAGAFVLRLKVNWMGKDTLFTPPFGYIMRGLGGIAVNRSKHTNVVEQLALEFRDGKKMALVVPASGTRKKTPFWKSGFYWIAIKANVPIVCGYLDYRKKIAGLGLSFVPTGDVTADMDRIREFYRDIQGKYPDKVSTPVLKEELQENASD